MPSALQATLDATVEENALNTSRSLRQSVARMLIGVLLLAQLALSAYACPGLDIAAASGEPTATKAATAAMPPGCGDIDLDAANLCVEHCRYGQQSAEHSHAPAVQAAVLSFLYVIVSPDEPLVRSGDRATSPRAPWAAAADPPHAILHCVFRI